MTETELTDLLQTAARATGVDVRPDPSTLIARARRNRRRPRMAGLCAAIAVVLVGAAAIPILTDSGDGDVEVAAGEDKNDFKPGWTRLPDPPLSPRSDAVTVWTGSEVVVVGGSERSCPPAAGCPPPPPSSSLRDGAAFDVTTRMWRPVAPAPRPISGRMSASELGGDVFVLSECRGQPCADFALLRYRPADDAWDVLPPPPGEPGSQWLSRPGGAVVAYVVRSGRQQLWRFDLASRSWSELPEPPRLNQAVVLGDGDAVLVFGQPLPTPQEPRRSLAYVGSRLSGSPPSWVALPPARGGRVLPRVLNGLVVLEPEVPGSGGGILDLRELAWSPLPAPPAAPTLGPGAQLVKQTVGALGATTATFDAPNGWVLDTVTRAWIHVPPIDDRSMDGSFTSFGRRLFSFGGTAFPGVGTMLNDAWVWTAPAGAEAPAMTLAPDAVPATAPATAPQQAVAATPTSAPTPATTPIPGAPAFVSATADVSAGRLTVRFDRPVTGDPVDKSPGSKTFAPDKTHPMNMIVFGADQRCSSPQGNGQDYVAGLGTDTVTFEATSLAPGTTYVGIGQGVVKNVADGTFNSSVVVQGLPEAGMFAGMSCIPVKATGAVPTTVPYADPAGGPKLLSVTARAGGGGPGVPGGAGAGRVRLTFDKAVVPGDGPNFDGSSPNLQPAAGDNYMRAMQLVVHTTDSTCSSPNGNAHEYLSGVGTTTLTVDATSLVVGTTYISIAPGFAKGKADGKAMAWVRCMAIQVTP